MTDGAPERAAEAVRLQGSGSRQAFDRPDETLTRSATNAGRTGTGPPPSAAATILAVDDSTESLALVSRILSAAGYKVRLADSGALALAAAFAAPPDLILLDLKMPGLDGLEVCRRLKARPETRDAPVILLSAYAGVQEWVQGLQLGAADHIGKPVQADELLVRVKTQLALAQARSQAAEADALRRLNEQLAAEIVRRKAMEADLQALFNASDAAIALLDRHGKILELNETGASRFHRRREELIGTCFYDHLSPEVAAVRRPRIEEVFATGRAVRFEDMRSGLRIDQIMVPICDPCGAVVRVAAFAYDVTEQRQAEVELRRLNQRFDLAARAANLGVWDWDVVNNRLIWDERMYALYGVRSGNFDGAYAAWIKGLHPEDVARCEEEVRQSLHGEKEFDTEFRVIWPDGTVKHLRAFAVVVREAGGRPLRQVGVNFDVTTQRSTEEKLRQALREKEVLLKEVHHRVKNNLQVVSGLLDLQGERLPDPQLRQALTECKDRIRSIALVHENLYQTTGLAQLDFRQYVQSLVTHLFRTHLGRGQTVRFELKMTETALALSVAVPCGLVINELVTNALKHAAREHGPGEEPKIVLTWEEVGAHWRITVADNGPGLPADWDATRAETLGLRLVHLLAGQLRGSFRAEPGAGCRAVFEFPKP